MFQNTFFTGYFWTTASFPTFIIKGFLKQKLADVIEMALRELKRTEAAPEVFCEKRCP